jgi:membrane-bound metal-dependent hydrolase YbcI (DUF457 family)
MPFTPFHFGPGAALYALAPRHVSFLSFCVANILIDVEPLYYMLAQQYPLHRFFHTYIGATLVLVASFALFVLARWLATFVSIPNLFQWLNFKPVPVAIGAAAGNYSHIMLDSVMHGDITPLAPLSEANILLGLISMDALHWSCVAAGLAGVVLLGVRRVLNK